MKLQCPHCHGFGLYKVRRHWWERLLHVERRYYCVDCETSFLRSRIVEVA